MEQIARCSKSRFGGQSETQSVRQGYGKECGAGEQPNYSRNEVQALQSYSTRGDASPLYALRQSCQGEREGVLASKVVDSLINPSGHSADHTASKTFADVVRAQLSSLTTSSSPINVGLMMSNDSSLSRLITTTSSSQSPATDSPHPHLLPHSPLLPPQRHDPPLRFGSISRSNHLCTTDVRRLRTLDEGPLRGESGDKCDLIFVEALEDEGVGLAVMNRLKKAASETVVLDC